MTTSEIAKFPRDVRAAAKEQGLGMILICYVTAAGGSGSQVAPATAEEIAVVQQAFDRVLQMRMNRPNNDAPTGVKA